MALFTISIDFPSTSGPGEDGSTRRSAFIVTFQSRPVHVPSRAADMPSLVDVDAPNPSGEEGSVAAQTTGTNHEHTLTPEQSLEEIGRNNEADSAVTSNIDGEINEDVGDGSGLPASSDQSWANESGEESEHRVFAEAVRQGLANNLEEETRMSPFGLRRRRTIQHFRVEDAEPNTPPGGIFDELNISGMLSLVLLGVGVGSEDPLLDLALRLSLQQHPPRPAADKAAVDALPIEPMKATLCDDTSDDNPALCVICQEIMIVGALCMSMPCAHFFHPNCLHPWLKLNNTCPTCRFEIKAEETPSPSHEESSPDNNETNQSNTDTGTGARVIVAELFHRLLNGLHGLRSHNTSEDGEDHLTADPPSDEPLNMNLASDPAMPVSADLSQSLALIEPSDGSVPDTSSPLDIPIPPDEDSVADRSEHIPTSLSGSGPLLSTPGVIEPGYGRLFDWPMDLPRPTIQTSNRHATEPINHSLNSNINPNINSYSNLNSRRVTRGNVGARRARNSARTLLPWTQLRDHDSTGLDSRNEGNERPISIDEAAWDSGMPQPLVPSLPILHHPGLSHRMMSILSGRSGIPINNMRRRSHSDSYTSTSDEERHGGGSRALSHMPSIDPNVHRVSALTPSPLPDRRVLYLQNRFDQDDISLFSPEHVTTPALVPEEGMEMESDFSRTQFRLHSSTKLEPSGIKRHPTDGTLSSSAVFRNFRSQPDLSSFTTPVPMAMGPTNYSPSQSALSIQSDAGDLGSGLWFN